MSESSQEVQQRPGAASTALGCVFQVYAFGVVIAEAYFNWLYAKEHTFLDWIFFGWIVATFKALLWPIFVWF